MTERPIIFSGPMVRATLGGRKAQTRRVVRPQPDFVSMGGTPEVRHPIQVVVGGRIVTKTHDEDEHLFVRKLKCPYGVPGDRLWVRETFCQPHNCDLKRDHPAKALSIAYAADGGKMHHVALSGFVQNNRDFKWHPSIHMPRWASRITLDVAGIRVERLQEISEEDAKAEGFVKEPSLPIDPRDWFRNLWGSINGEGSWEANPWVWVIEFQQAGER